MKAWSAVADSNPEAELCLFLNRYLMEFICVLSVEGTLLSYQVSKEEDDGYLATLRNVNAKRDDVPALIRLHKNESGWHAEPWHTEIVSCLTQAIDAAN
jgi:hypothetical protein